MRDLQERIHIETMRIEELKLKVDIWETVIDVQKHFNELEMKVRNFGVLILSAFIGAISVSFNASISLNVLNYSLPVASMLAFGASIVWMLFYFVDVYWYHPLLLGAVKKGMALESEIAVDLVNVDLTKTIGDNSPQDIFFWKGIHSTTKAQIFYFGILLVLISSGIAMSLFNTPAKTNQLEKIKIEAQCIRTTNYDGYDCAMESLPVKIN